MFAEVIRSRFTHKGLQQLTTQEPQGVTDANFALAKTQISNRGPLISGVLGGKKRCAQSVTTAKHPPFHVHLIAFASKVSLNLFTLFLH